MVDPKIENCKSCGERYKAQVYHDDENPHFSGFTYQICPNCDYNPNVEKKIMEAIDRNAQLIILPRPTTQEGARTDITINADELTQLVVKEFLKIWPKSSSKK